MKRNDDFKLSLRLNSCFVSNRGSVDFSRLQLQAGTGLELPAADWISSNHQPNSLGASVVCNGPKFVQTTVTGSLENQGKAKISEILDQFWMQVSRPLVEVVRLGLVSYQEGLRLQQVYINRLRSSPAHALLLCEHPPVYTTGIRHEPYPGALLDRLRLLGADVHRANRGGLITFHGPGQLVCYPVLNLCSFKKSIRWYVGQLERTIITLCSRFGVEATTSPHTGVWVGEQKICAIGVHCGRYVTSHGLALNCNTDLSWFRHIVPCGIEGKGVTSLSRQLQRDVCVEETVPHLLDAFRQHFTCRLTDGDAPESDEDSGVS